MVTLSPIVLFLLVFICTPFIFLNKKIFFLKSHINISTQHTFNINLFFLKFSLINFILILFYLNLCFFWNPTSIIITNKFYFLFLLNILFLVAVFFTLKLNSYKLVVSWELYLCYIYLFIFIPFFFLNVNIYIYFFLIEIFANLIFFILFLESNNLTFKFNFNLYNRLTSVYYQLIINSLVTFCFISLLLFNYNFTTFNLSLLPVIFIFIIMSFKVGLGPIIFFKWFIYKNITLVSMLILTVTYFYLFIFFLFFLKSYISYLMFYNIYFYFMFLLIINTYLLIFFFYKTNNILNFMQYSSYLTYSLLFALVIM